MSNLIIPDKIGRSLVLLSFMFLIACQSNKVITSPTAFQAECLLGLDFGFDDELYLSDSLEIPITLKSNLDVKTVEMAIALGVISELDRLLVEDLNEFERLQLKTHIHGKVMKMNLMLQSLVSALDCEEEKSEQLASYLEKVVRKKERNLTVAAIITGAAVGVGAGILLMTENGQSNWPEYLGIAGGLTEVFLGLSILKLDRRMSISHPKNILRDVYQAEIRPVYFPPAVWYYFNSNKPNQEGLSLKEQLVSRWETYNMSDDGIAVLLSDGGNYSAEMLKNRAGMLDQLESQVSLISKDLLHFLEQLEKIESKFRN